MAYRSKVSANAKAYYSGMGYAVAHKKKGINFKNTALKRIFAKGYAAGLRAMSKNPLKYANLPRKKKSNAKRG